MSRVVLIRHGRSTANAEGVLAGRSPGVSLDARGREEAAEVGRLLDGVPIAAAYTSPIQRCVETATLAGFPDAEVVDGLTECDYGEWTGAKLKDLSSREVWADVQARPSVVAFPGGESMLGMFGRVTETTQELAARHGKDDLIVLFSHGDPIKAMLAHAFGMELDLFQRIIVNPAGISIVDYHERHPMVLCTNAGGDLRALLGAGTSATPAVGGGDAVG